MGREGCSRCAIDCIRQKREERSFFAVFIIIERDPRPEDFFCEVDL